MDPTESRVVGALLSTNENDYVYDAYSNQIISLDKVEREIVQGLLQGLGRDKLLEKLRASCLTDEPTRVLVQCETTCKQLNVLQPVAVKGEVVPAPSLAFIKHQLNHHLHSLCLNVTEQCNFRCRYCVFGGAYGDNYRTHGEKRMSRETARKAIEFYAVRRDRETTPAVAFYGGEPLLAMDVIADAITCATQIFAGHEPHFSLTTNASLLKVPQVREFLVAQNIALLVSLDGPSQIHNAWRVTRSGTPTHAAVTEGLEKLAVEYPDYYRRRVTFNAVLTPPARTSEVVRYFTQSPLFTASSRHLRLNSVVFDEHEVFARARAGDPEATRREAEWTRNEYIRNRILDPRVNDGLADLYKGSHVMLAQRHMGSLDEKIVPRGFCVPGGRKLFVGSSGVLGMCEKVGEGIPIGTLAMGFDYERVADVLRALVAMWHPECAGCFARRFCSVCPQQVRGPNGAISSERFRAQCIATGEWKVRLLFRLRGELETGPSVGIQLLTEEFLDWIGLRQTQ